MADNQQLIISRTRSGLNVYAKQEFSEVFGAEPLEMEVEKLNDGSKVIRLFTSPAGSHHVTTIPRKAPGSYDKRLFVQNRKMLKNLREEFGPTVVEWTAGETGEAYLRLPTPDKRTPPTAFVHRGGKGGPLKRKIASPKIKVIDDPMDRLDRAMKAVNEILGRPDMSHVKLWGLNQQGDMEEITGRKIVGKIERTLGE